MARKILSVLLALLFLFAGVPKLLGTAQMVEAFQQMGYSQTFRLLVGLAEVTGAVALLVPGVALYGAVLLIGLMLGAVWTVLRIGQSVIPPVVVGVLLVALVVPHSRAPAATAGSRDEP